MEKSKNVISHDNSSSEDWIPVVGATLKLPLDPKGYQESHNEDWIPVHTSGIVCTLSLNLD